MSGQEDDRFIFYFSALVYGIASMIVIAHNHAIRKKRRLQGVYSLILFYGLMVVASSYTILVIVEAILHPLLFVNMSYGGVMHQLAQSEVRLTCVLHFNWGDPLCMLFLLAWANKNEAPLGVIVAAIPFFVLFAPMGMVVLVLGMWSAGKNGGNGIVYDLLE